MVKITAVNKDDQILLEQLLNADPVATRKVYDLALPSVVYWVQENNGTEADARDIFQEALIAVYQKLRESDFYLSCRLKSYLRIICRNLWLTRLRDQKKIQFTELNDVDEYTLDSSMMAQIERSEEEQLFFHYFDQLPEQCQKILQWFFDKTSMAEIAIRLSSSESYIKKRKFICKEKLVKSIQKDPRFKELIN